MTLVMTDEFDHLIGHVLACTLESEDVSDMGNERISFGSLDEVINDDDLESFGQGIEWLDQSKKVLNMGLTKCLEQGKRQGEHCTTKTIIHPRSEGC